MKQLATMTALVALCACGGGGQAAAVAHGASPPAVTPTVPAAPAVPSPALPAGGKPADWKLVWADEFDTDGLPDARRWAYDTEFNRTGWFNHELQYYAAGRLENSRVAAGKLLITARKEALTSMADYGGQQYSSARLMTRGLASWTYGFVEVRAKLPCGVGSWPAIWMLGSKGRWPDDGELDIMEHVGKNPGQILGSIYTAAQNWPAGTPNTTSTTVSDACTAFHNYQLTWNAERVVIGVDNRNYIQLINPNDGDYRKWPFSNPQYLLLNLAIGGDLGGKVDDSALPQQMEVEYVRVYQP
jgi:beta-glucanase (GH16 family)